MRYFLCLIQFVSDLGQVGGFLRVLWFPPPLNNKRTNHHDITEIRLKVALNTITLTPIPYAINTCTILTE